MAFKFIAAFTLVTIATAGYVPQPQVYHAAPVAHTVAVSHEPAQHILTKSVEEYDHHPQYNVAYNVHDSITGDVKSQSESRDGDVVNGEYSLVDADGYKRTVSYTADAEHGFNAVVNRVPLHEVAHHDSHATPAVVKHLTPVVHSSPSYTYAAPAVVKTVTPVSYAAPSSYHQTVSTPIAAPSQYKAAPVTYTTSNLVKTVSPSVTYAGAAPSHAQQYVSSPSYTAPANYHVQSTYAAPATYHAQPTYSAPSVTYQAQPLYAAPANYHAHSQPIYAAPSVVKTVSPVISASPSYYKSAPVAYVKSSEHSNQYHH